MCLVVNGDSISLVILSGKQPALEECEHPRGCGEGHVRLYQDEADHHHPPQLPALHQEPHTCFRGFGSGSSLKLVTFFHGIGVPQSQSWQRLSAGRISD